MYEPQGTDERFGQEESTAGAGAALGPANEPTTLVRAPRAALLADPGGLIGPVEDPEASPRGTAEQVDEVVLVEIPGTLYALQGSSLVRRGSGSARLLKLVRAASFVRFLPAYQA